MDVTQLENNNDIRSYQIKSWLLNNDNDNDNDDDDDNNNIHPRCSKLRLNHLVFADDLMLFCKGEMSSISTLTHVVDLFSSSFGLFSNNNKFGIYLAGVDNEFRAQAASILDFSFEWLPLKYLGMPLTSKRYIATNCEYIWWTKWQLEFARGMQESSVIRIRFSWAYLKLEQDSDSP